MASLDNALVIFSGGQDSTTCLHYALNRFKRVEALCFDYGQRHQIEILAAKKIAELTKVKLHIFKLNLFKELGGNALVSDMEIKIKNNANQLPNTFVPGRNILFLNIGAIFAYNLGFNRLITGVSAAESSGYPDCKDDTVKALQVTLNLGMNSNLTIDTPLMFLEKKGVVELGVREGALGSLAYSYTCYEGSKEPCLKCPSCILRQNGFFEAGIDDPYLVRLKNERAN